jgi:predicted MFS family arabinose efflux permease
MSFVMVTAPAARPEAGGKPRFNPRSLDAVNFLLADTQGGLGPYLDVFLVTGEGWPRAWVGALKIVDGVLGLCLRTPLCSLIDRTRAKRTLLAIAISVIALCALAIYLSPHFLPVIFANSLMAMAGVLTGPTVAAITLGAVSRKALGRRLGRNAAFDHAGNVSVALIAGAVGWALGQSAVFLLVPAFAVLAITAVYSIPASAIDHDRARGGMRQAESGGSWWTALKEHPALMTYGCCALLFHFANAPLLPLVGQKLAFANKEFATAAMSACIIGAQAVMLPVALIAGRTADRIGRKPVLLAGFLILPLRAFLYTVSDDPSWLLGVQLLDGVGAGIFGAITPLVAADIMQGSGRFNLAQGTVGTMQGIGAASSGLVAGLIADQFGYRAAFAALGSVAVFALITLVVFMPETCTGSGKGRTV